MSRSLRFLTAQPIAHRGLHNDKVPENSLAAFRAAIKKGYAIELDVHATADGGVVVFHDDDLRRMTNKRTKVKKTETAKLTATTLRDTKEKIPTFEEVLKLVDGKVPLLVELKSDGAFDDNFLFVTANLLKNYEGKFAIQSFDPRIVAYFCKHYPKMLRGQLVSDFKRDKSLGWLKRLIISHMWYNKISQPDFVSYDIRALPCRRATKIRQQVPVLGWTIRSEAEFERVKKLCDGFICEDILWRRRTRLI